MKLTSIRYLTKNPRQTKAWAKTLVPKLSGGQVINLIGNLGAGKTTFVKGLAQGLGIKKTITSPTFVLFKVYAVNKHKTIKQLVHVDCYRLPGKEFFQIGLADYLNHPETLVVVEWAEKLKLNKKNVETITFSHTKNLKERLITIK